MNSTIFPIGPRSTPDTGAPTNDAPETHEDHGFASFLALAWLQPPSGPPPDVELPSFPPGFGSPSVQPTGDKGQDSIGVIAEPVVPTAADGTVLTVENPFVSVATPGPDAIPLPAAAEANVAQARNALATLSSATPVGDPSALTKKLLSSDKLARSAAPPIEPTPAPAVPKVHVARTEDARRTTAVDEVRQERETDASTRDDAKGAAGSGRGTDDKSVKHASGGSNASSSDAHGDDAAPDHAYEVRSESTEQRPTRPAAADAEAMLNLIASTRKSATVLNASSLKPLFDGAAGARPVRDVVAKTESVGSTAETASSLVSGAPFARATAHASDAQAVVGQTFDAVLNEFDRLGRREAKHLSIHLSPEELGDVEVKLTKDAAGRLSAFLVVDRDSTRHSLSAGIETLRHSLEQAGVTVDRLDVGVGTDGGSTSGEGSHGGNGSATKSPRETDPLGRTDVAAASDDDRLLSIRA